MSIYEIHKDERGWVVSVDGQEILVCSRKSAAASTVSFARSAGDQIVEEDQETATAGCTTR